MFLFCSGPPELCSQPVLSGQEASPAVSKLTACRRWPSISVGSWPGHPALRATWGQLPSGQGAGDGTLNLSFLAQKLACQTPHPESQVGASRRGPGPLWPFTCPPPPSSLRAVQLRSKPWSPDPRKKNHLVSEPGLLQAFCIQLSNSSPAGSPPKESLSPLYS